MKHHDTDESCCDFCLNWGVKLVDTDNSDDICEDCITKYVTMYIKDDVYVNGYEISKNMVEGVQHGFHFRSYKNPLTGSFTDPTIEGGLKRIL